MSAPALSATPFTGLDSARFAEHLSQRAYLPAWWLEAKKAAGYYTPDAPAGDLTRVVGRDLKDF